MGRKNKNKGQKNKSNNKKPNKGAGNKKTEDKAPPEECIAKQPTEEVTPSEQGAVASGITQSHTTTFESPPSIPDGRQSRACFHRSLRDEFENQQRLSSSSDGSVSSSAERAFVAEIENAIGKGGIQSEADDGVPRLDLRFVNDSESEYSERTQKTQNGLFRSSSGNSDHGRREIGEGLSYIEIKSQSPQKIEDQESGIGTCSNTEVTHAEERHASLNSTEVIDRVDLGGIRRGESSNDDDDDDEQLEEKVKMILNQDEPFMSSESMSSMPEDVQGSSHTEEVIDMVSQAQDIEVRAMNASGELTDIGFTQANIHSNMYEVTAISEPNLVRCDSEQSISLIDDTSDGGSTEKKNSSLQSTPRSFAELGSDDGPFGLIAGQSNFRSEQSRSSDVILGKMARSNPELQTLEDTQLDSSVDNLPIDNVTFTDQGVSIYEEIKKASNEELDLGSKIYVEDIGNIRVLEIKEQDEFSPLCSGPSSIGKSPVSSVKEGGGASNPESVTGYATSPSEGSKTLSHGDSRSDLSGRTPSDVIDRLPEFMRSAPGLLEAQKLEETYKEFMSNSDISERDHSAAGDVETSSTGRYEQLSKFEYKICYDMDEKEPVHPGEVYVRGEMPHEDLNAPFAIESNENIADSSHHVEILKDVEAILQDREHVSMVLSNMNQEIENLRMENRHLYGEMTMYRNSCKQYRGKSDSMAGYIKNLRSHVKSLEIQMADINSQRQNMKAGFTMTDKVLLFNTSSQVVPVMYDAHVQTETQVMNKGVQADGSIMNSNSTLTPQLVGLVAPSQSTLEEGERKAPAKASIMVDKLLQQMTNINENVEQASVASAGLSQDEPETLDKWRRLAMMPLSADHVVLQLQKSLASATVEFDKIETKLKEREQLVKKLKEDMEAKEDSRTDDIEKVMTECESWQMKYEGDHTEIEMLRQKVGGLEKNLLVTQMERDKLREEVETIITQPKDDLSTDQKNTEIEENLEKLKQIETEKKSLEEEVERYRGSQQEELVKVTHLEQSLKDTEERKGLVENELKIIKEEYETLQKALQSLEGVFQLRAGEKEPEDFSKVAQAKIELLKKHVFEPRSVTKPRVSETSSSVASTSSGAVSLHEDIIQQSELVLHILKETGDLEDEEASSKEELVNWNQVRNSIENQLAGKSEENSPKDSAENPADLRSQSENEEYCGANDPEVKSHLNELAEAIGSDLGLKLNIVIEDNNKSTTVKDSQERLLEEKKAKRNMEIDRKTAEYETMRKKRLSMLVQAYTGRDTDELLSSSSASKDGHSYRDQQNGRSEGKPDIQSIEQKATAFRKELLKDMPQYTASSSASLPKTGYFSDAKDEYSSSQRDSVLRQSKEDLDHLLSKSKVPRVCVSRKSSTGMLAASTTDSTTPYSYRFKREIYPHKKGYLPVDQFYDEKERDNNMEEDASGYNDTYYGEYSQNGYPPESIERYDGYSAAYGDEEAYYDPTNIKDKKEALVKLRAKLLKKKRQQARERDRRSPREENGYTGYDDDVQEYEAIRPTMSKTWSPQQWKEQEKSPDLKSIKQSIKDYTSHLRTKYSKLNLDSADPSYGKTPKYAWEQSGGTLRDASSSLSTYNSPSTENYAPLYRSTAPMSNGSSVSQYESSPYVQNSSYASPISPELPRQRDHAYSTSGNQYNTKYSSPSDVTTWTSSYSANGQSYADTKPTYTNDSYKVDPLPSTSSGYKQSDIYNLDHLPATSSSYRQSEDYHVDQLPSTSSGYKERAQKSVFVSYEENERAGKASQEKYNVKFTEMEEIEKTGAGYSYPREAELTDKELYHREMQRTLENNHGAKRGVPASDASRSDPFSYKSHAKYSSNAYDWSEKENGYETNDYHDKPDHYLTTQERDILTKHDLHADEVSHDRIGEKRYDDTSLLERRLKEDFVDTSPKYSSTIPDKYSEQKRPDSFKDNKYSFTKRSSSATRYSPPKETQPYLDDTLTKYSSSSGNVRQQEEEITTREKEIPERTFFDYSKDASVKSSSHQSIETQVNDTRSKVSSDKMEHQKPNYASSNDLVSQSGSSSAKQGEKDETYDRYTSKYTGSRSSSADRDYMTRSDSLKPVTGYEPVTSKIGDLSSINRTESGSISRIDSQAKKPLSVYDTGRQSEPSSNSNPGSSTRADVSSKYEGSSKDSTKSKYYSSIENVSSKPPLPTRAAPQTKVSYSQSSTHKAEANKDLVKTDAKAKTYQLGRPESPYRSSSPYISNESEGSSKKYKSKTESPYRSSSPYMSGVSDSSNAGSYTASQSESIYRSNSPYPNSQADSRSLSTHTTSQTESPYRSSSPYVTSTEKQSSLTSSEIDQLKSKYDTNNSSSTTDGAMKPVLSKEYLDYMNKSSSIDTHKMEINQRLGGVGIHDDRKLSQDDACSVTSSAVSDADFVVTSTGDIVKRKSKSAKKMDKARNIELQMMSYDGPDKHEVFKSHTEPKSSQKSKEKSSDYKNSISSSSRSSKYDHSGESYSQKTRDFLKEEEDKWKEPRRHFGLREEEQNTEDLLWREPKVYTSSGSQSRGYVETGASSLSSSRLAGNTDKDDEWYRSQGSQEDSKDVIEEPKGETDATENLCDKPTLPDETATEIQTSTSTTVVEKAEAHERLQRRVQWERPPLHLHGSKAPEQSSTKQASHSYSSNRHPTAKNDKTNSSSLSAREQRRIPFTRQTPGGDKSTTSPRTRVEVTRKPRTRLSDKSIPIADITVSKCEESLKPVALSTGETVVSSFTQPTITTTSSSPIPATVPTNAELSKIRDSPDKPRVSEPTNKPGHSSIDDKQSQSPQSESLPRDPLARQQLITDIIGRYTKDMDQCYISHRDQKVKPRHGVKNRNFSNSRSSDDGSPSRGGENTSGYSSHATTEDEPVLPLKSSNHKSSSYTSLTTSRSPSRSPAHSRKSSVERGDLTRSRIPISRSLSRERDEGTGKSPTQSRKSSVESEHRSQIPVKINSLGEVIEESGRMEEEQEDRKQKQKDLAILEDKTRHEIDKIMRKYNMYNEEWEKPQEDKAMKELLG